MRLTLKAARVNVGLTQADAGKLIGVSPDVISNWERYVSFPDVTQLPKIEKAYNVKYDDIIFLPNNVGITENKQAASGQKAV